MKNSIVKSNILPIERNGLTYRCQGLWKVSNFTLCMRKQFNPPPFHGLWQKTQDFWVRDKVLPACSMSALSTLAAKPPRNPSRCCTCSGFLSQLKNSLLKEPKSFIMDCKRTGFCPKGDITFNILNSKQIFPLLSDVNILKKIVQNKRQLRHAGTWKTHGKTRCATTIFTLLFHRVLTHLRFSYEYAALSTTLINLIKS